MPRGRRCRLAGAVEYPIVILLHVLSGVIWAGGAIAAGFFFLPAVLESGPAGGVVMGGVVRRKFPIAMTAAAGMVVLTGVRLYMIRFTSTWLGSPEGLVLTLGGVLGLGAFVIGIFFQKPAAEKLSALGAKVAAAGRPPTPAEAAELTILRTRLGRVGRLTAWHLLGAAALMASHRFAALL